MKNETANLNSGNLEYEQARKPKSDRQILPVMFHVEQFWTTPALELLYGKGFLVLRVCAWCKKDMAPTSTSETPDQVTHSICHACLAAQEQLLEDLVLETEVTLA